jgi:proteasome lid subunit RPN8/RPN11
VVGAYHSHPRSHATPSATDAADAFAGFLYVIVGLTSIPPELTAWIWADGNFTPVPLVRS